MNNVKEICEAVGRRQIAEAVGVGSSAVTNAIASQEFPSAWFKVVKSLCADRGMECPDSLFNFVKPVSSKRGRATA